jgi:hypothetical protein
MIAPNPPYIRQRSHKPLHRPKRIHDTACQRPAPINLRRRHNPGRLRTVSAFQT